MENSTHPDDPQASADLSLAWRLADRADQLTMDRYQAADLVVETKPDLSHVTEADKLVESTLKSLIATACPDDLFAGEEYGGMTPGTVPPGRVWIIDPIDGTANYVRGVPVWATLIALVIDGVPTVGIVSAPALGRRWHAILGGGAHVLVAAGGTVASRECRVSAVSDLADASFSYSDLRLWEETSPGAFETFTSTCWRSRAYGDFYSHMLVAEGAVDFAAEPQLNAWDVAALVPIVNEAGGRMTGYDGSDVLTAGSGVTSNGVLHDEVLRVLAR